MNFGINFTFARPLALAVPTLLLTGLASFMVRDDGNKPDETRFTPVVVAEDLDEPMVFEVTKDGSAYIIERKGGFKKYDPASQTVNLIGTISVNTKYTSKEGKVSEAEEGLMGLSLDPKFDQNHWVYLYYAHPTEKKHILTRWELKDDKLVEASQKVMLEVPTQREVCCHTGGGMTWDRSGNLYLTVGNNTGNQQAAQTDEREGRSSWDDQGHAGNTNDLRGKILRIHPEADGTYTVPEGNLFPKGTVKTRPEIYSMGHRNPWRISIDSQTGYLYWGEVGPDATKDSEIGPRGYDELNQGRKPGNFGWPWFVGNRQAFPVYDYANLKPLDKKDPDKIINASPNNTGLTELPPVAPSFIYYPYAVSEEFPLVGTGSRSATGGPIYHQTDFKGAKRPWPAFYEGKWIATDFSRGWIMAITMDAQGNYQSMERILSGYHPVEPIDMKFGPDGDLYVLEYGSNWFRKSDNARLVRVEYNGGNRKPLVQASASKKGGTVPLQLTLSADGSKDYDGDALTYQWKVTSPGAAPRTLTGPNPAVTFDKPGVYTAQLTVTDAHGAANSQSVRIIAGNEAPTVSVNLSSNRTFFFPDQPIQYTVAVTDKEDGSLAESSSSAPGPGKISPARVAMSIDYTSEGFDYAEVMQAQRSVDAATQYAVAQSLINQSDCKVCHQIATKSVGPAFTAVAAKYRGDASATERLVSKIRQGGVGVWGEVAMPGHPSMPVADVQTLVHYILNIDQKTLSSLPLQGTYAVKLPQGDNGKGSVLIRAAYSDRGGLQKSAKPIPAQTAEQTIVLRSPQINATMASVKQGVDVKSDRSEKIMAYPNSYLGFRQFDLTGIKQLQLDATAQRREGSAGGTIEVRLDSPTGTLIGEKVIELAPEVDMAKLMAQMESGNSTKPASGSATAGNAQGAAGTAGAKPGAAPPNPFARPPVFLGLQPTEGVHDLFFVFKNEQAKSIQPLMSLGSIKFQNSDKQ